ncbi:phage late control D family protein [Anaeroselena agilis]|uniref:Contractile injection system protein, VgrG/Pvc8 family n=1 Tax=Anaeroselena agilis TaxID=3063788 RepID=A0ABU3NYF4_9FIRM|nr:contractile injection system protein, VgrG/Pvc8 family [Selenomonadales bacterium 4137-cl]
MTARQAWLDVKYEGTNITEDLRPYLKGWTFTDNLSGQSDELQITLMDKDQLWQGDWFPDEGAKISATIRRRNWKDDDAEDELPLGEMEIDEIDGGYPPSEVTIKALSVPQSSALKGENKNRAWEKTKLSAVAGDISAGAGVSLYYDVADDPEYDRVEQTEETDLHFIMRLCREAGLAFKVSDKQLVIFDEAKFEQADPVLTIDKKVFPIKQYRGRATLHDTYKSCCINYRSPKGRKKYDYEYAPPNPPNTQRVLVLRERFDSLAEAERKAKKALREKNSRAWQFSMTISADLRLMASMVVILKNFGKFDGRWLITQVTHAQSGSGYDVSLQMRRCLEGY